MHYKAVNLKRNFGKVNMLYLSEVQTEHNSAENLWQL